MNPAKNPYELGLDGSLRPTEDTLLPILRNMVRVRRTAGASLLRVR